MFDTAGKPQLVRIPSAEERSQGAKLELLTSHPIIDHPYSRPRWVDLDPLRSRPRLDTSARHPKMSDSDVSPSSDASTSKTRLFNSSSSQHGGDSTSASSAEPAAEAFTYDYGGRKGIIVSGVARNDGVPSRQDTPSYTGPSNPIRPQIWSSIRSMSDPEFQAQLQRPRLKPPPLNVSKSYTSYDLNKLPYAASVSIPSGPNTAAASRFPRSQDESLLMEVGGSRGVFRDDAAGAKTIASGMKPFRKSNFKDFIRTFEKMFVRDPAESGSKNRHPVSKGASPVKAPLSTASTTEQRRRRLLKTPPSHMSSAARSGAPEGGMREDRGFTYAELEERLPNMGKLVEDNSSFSVNTRRNEVKQGESKTPVSYRS